LLLNLLFQDFCHAEVLRANVYGLLLLWLLVASLTLRLSHQFSFFIRQVSLFGEVSIRYHPHTLLF
jgi:hypothetical protein